MLSEKTRKSILELQKLYPEKRSALDSGAAFAQAEVGYLPREMQNEVAELFGIDPNEVNSVVTFYDMFFEEPVGKHLHSCLQKCIVHAARSGRVLKKLCISCKSALGKPLPMENLR